LSFAKQLQVALKTERVSLLSRDNIVVHNRCYSALKWVLLTTRNKEKKYRKKIRPANEYVF
jgi:hypothetical protein